MKMIVILDAGPLGMVSNPKAELKNKECYDWMEDLILKGVDIVISEIADYEVRRELLRANKIQGIKRLDLIKNTLTYRPLSTAIMLKSAQLWADIRKQGKPTADPKALDCDVILAAQALEIGAIVATENVNHLSLMVTAKYWKNITI